MDCGEESPVILERKYWTLHWLQPVVCKVFPSWCWEWMGISPRGDPAGAPHSHSAQFCCIFPALHPISGVGIQPFADGFFSWVSGLITLYSLCFHRAARSLFQPHIEVEGVCTAELDEYCKIKSLSASGFWAGSSGEQHSRGQVYQRVWAHRPFGLFFENASVSSLRGLSLSHPKVCSTHLGMWVGRSQPTGPPGCCIHEWGECQGCPRGHTVAGWATNMLLKSHSNHIPTICFISISKG